MLYLYYELSKGGLGMDKTVAGGIVGAYGGGVYFLRLFASPQISAQHKRHFVA